jgi:UDP-N-acetylmuramoyl-L-alanyl-D-glutamate--2,6-diaminopimelate ligase
MKFSKLTRQREIGIRAISFANGSQDADLSDPQYDSRTVKPGSVFFASKGYADDGHKYIPNAIDRGASVIVLEDENALSEEEAKEKNITRILVGNSRKALAIISEEAFGSPSSKLRLIGVTGTNGKTTTTNLIKQLLEYRGETVGLIGTLGIWIGNEHIPTEHTPLCFRAELRHV